MKEVYIVDAARSAVGSFLGSLKNLSASEIAVPILKAIIRRNQIDPNEVSEVILGQVLVAGQGQNPARQTAINAGLPSSIPAYGISHVCGSGIKSVMVGAQSIMTGQSSIVIAGGQESMSQAQHSSYIRQGVKMGSSELSDTMISDGLLDAFANYHMGITAENIAEKFEISREEQDSFACASQNKAEKAQKEHNFEGEIIPIEIKSRKDSTFFGQDEFVRHNTTIESLARLKPAFKKDGTVTAGNASGLNDGAAMLLLMDEDAVKKYNLQPLGKIKSFATVGVDPSIMGIGPVYASKKALDIAGWKVGELDLIESNEAFAVQSIAVNKEMKWDVKKVNVNGGAIAIGHPIGASGARILTTLLHQMKRQNAKKAIATLCIGGGMGNAVCVESFI